jgi:hypothetical protein
VNKAEGHPLLLLDAAPRELHYVGHGAAQRVALHLPLTHTSPVEVQSAELVHGPPPLVQSFSIMQTWPVGQSVLVVQLVKRPSRPQKPLPPMVSSQKQFVLLWQWNSTSKGVEHVAVQWQFPFDR